MRTIRQRSEVLENLHAFVELRLNLFSDTKLIAKAIRKIEVFLDSNLSALICAD